MSKVLQLENDLNSGLSDSGALGPFIVRLRLVLVCVCVCVCVMSHVCAMCVHGCTWFHHYLFFLLGPFPSSNGISSQLPDHPSPWLPSQV